MDLRVSPEEIKRGASAGTLERRRLSDAGVASMGTSGFRVPRDISRPGVPGFISGAVRSAKWSAEIAKSVAGDTKAAPRGMHQALERATPPSADHAAGGARGVHAGLPGEPVFGGGSESTG